MAEHKQSVTTEEVKQVAEFLAKLEPGYLPFPIFYQLMRITVQPTVELVPLRQHKGKLEVLLTKRPEKDPDWAGLWHIPGTVLRATDEKNSFDDAFKRILEGEIDGVKPLSKPVFMGHYFTKVKRGSELQMLHWVEIEGEPASGKFFDVSYLPDNIVDHHVHTINKAVAHRSLTIE